MIRVGDDQFVDRLQSYAWILHRRCATGWRGSVDLRFGERVVVMPGREGS